MAYGRAMKRSFGVKRRIRLWLTGGIAIVLHGLAVALLALAAFVLLLNVTALRGLATPVDKALALHLAIGGAVAIGLGLLEPYLGRRRA